MEAGDTQLSPQCYCQKVTTDVAGMLRCDQCWQYFHISCLKSGKPGRLVGDIFFNFTCCNCSTSGVESVERMKKMSWQKTQTWFGTVAGTLSSWCPVYFTSGMKELKQSGWWKLTNNSPPSLDILNARLVKKQKSPQRSSGMNAEQKVEGLRSRLKKSTIEAAIELRAKRDIPATSGRKRRKKTVDDVDLAPVSSPQYIDNVDDDFGSELTDNSQMSNSSFTAFDYMDQSSQMSRSSCRSDWLTEKDLVVGDTLPEYLLKEDEGNDDEDIDIDPCRLSPDQLMSTAASDSSLPNLGDILSNLQTDGECKPDIMHLDTSAGPSLTIDRLRLHSLEEQETDKLSAAQYHAPSVDGSSADGDGFERVLSGSGYHSEMDERCSLVAETTETCAKNIKRKRTFKKESTPQPKTEQAPTVVRMSLYEEKQLLKKLRQKAYSSALSSSSTNIRLKRFHRKLCVRQQQRERNIPVFDLDLFMQRLTKVSDTVCDMEQENLCFDIKTEFFDGGDERILDRYQHVQHQCQQTQQVSFLSRLIGNEDEQLQTVYSPYTRRVLKPFIRRDFESRPLKMRLLQEIVMHHHRNDPDWKPDPLPPIDYCYVKPQHIPAINALCREYFWPGIDMSESLMYPECSGVVLYRKLVIGFAFMVPANFNEMYISFLFTHPEWRRAGIASFLLYHLTQTYRRKELTLHVSASNPAMLLYQKFGFKPEQFIVDFYDKYFPAESTECRHAFFLRLVPPKEDEDPG